MNGVGDALHSVSGSLNAADFPAILKGDGIAECQEFLVHKYHPDLHIAVASVVSRGIGAKKKNDHLNVQSLRFRAFASPPFERSFVVYLGYRYNSFSVLPKFTQPIRRICEPMCSTSTE